jgi:hypothetical protein
VKHFFLDLVWARLALPVALVVAHLAITVLALLSLAVTEWLLRNIGIDGKIIPGTNMKLGNWISDLEVFAATVIIIAGAIEALVVLLLHIILDSAGLVRKIGEAWRS